MNETAQKDVNWSPRVPMWKVRRLYQLESKGVYDEELLNEVGWMLYERCRDILTIHDALNGVVTCPRCANAGQTSRIPRLTHAREEVLTCPTCGWALTWYDYHLTFKRQQLNPGGAVAAFVAYVRDFALARTPQAKMLVIDQVIHAFHYSLRDQPDLPTRPAGVNLIVGNLTEVMRFLDELSSLPNSPEIQATHAAWHNTLNAVPWLKIPESADERVGESADERVGE